ncbi:PaaI family thioesterase [Novosphingobium malaysiense]|uniref:PaaI family thioesterase n=1 Tax=Novosphingobium malaysiense TaxID=1348853 RepID=UPI000689352D|nr:PaaI family thioesterase [Novosphingobium malaysiense]
MAIGENITQEVARKLDKNYARFFGFEVVEARPGAVILSLAHRPEFEHAPGWFEGAITSAIGQIAASYSGATAAAEGWTNLVLDHSVRYVGAAQGERLVAVGRVTRSGRAISFTGADVYVERDGERHLCAQLEMTMRHTPPRD